MKKISKYCLCILIALITLTGCNGGTDLTEFSNQDFKVRVIFYQKDATEKTYVLTLTRGNTLRSRKHVRYSDDALAVGYIDEQLFIESEPASSTLVPPVVEQLNEWMTAFIKSGGDSNSFEDIDDRLESYDWGVIVQFGGKIMYYVRDEYNDENIENIIKQMYDLRLISVNFN